MEGTTSFNPGFLGSSFNEIVALGKKLFKEEMFFFFSK